MSDTEQKRYVFFHGERVEFIRRANIFGKEYYDILLPNGMKKTVPATSCQNNNAEKEH